MSLTLALVGNPNSGKTTLFNSLTGSNQFVGNWPGVTVEKKEGKYRKNKEVAIMDLPGIYSLSPYTLEEVVSRNYLLNEKPDAIINIIDATNIERNLYLTTQVLELGIPTVIALNMMDIIEKNGIKVNSASLSKKLNCPVIEISALKDSNVDEVINAATKASKDNTVKPVVTFEKNVEKALAEIETELPTSIIEKQKRFYSIKVLEKDEKIGLNIEKANSIIETIEKELDDETESYITSARYDYISSIIDDVVTKTGPKLSTSDKIDRILTNRWLGLPIFALVMYLVYYISVSTVGSWVTDWTNDVFVGEWCQATAQAFLEGIGCSEWLIGLIVDGIIGGVGSMVGFMPQMAVVFLFLALLEDCGYMARVAFVMDRVFRFFGMSGKSFIPMLIGMGCGLPGIMASRTIENQHDRRLTIMTVTFMPCGAKLPFIACMAGALFNNSALVAFSCYLMGIASVIITGIILKKFKMFAGDVTPFVMELPAYHMPTVKNVWHSVSERLMAFARKAVTILTLVSIFIWVISTYGWEDGIFCAVESIDNSIAANIGNAIAFVFGPCGFANWQTSIASLLGLAAKEEIVGVMGELVGMEEALDVVETGGNLAAIASLFTSPLAGYSYLAFNLLCIPCLPAVNTMRGEMNNTKYFLFAVAYQLVYAWAVSVMIFQIGSLIITKTFTAATALGFVLLAAMIYLLFRKGYQLEK